MTLEAGTLVGKYVIKRKLAEGGMAEIYLATSVGPEGFEKEVVIKRVRSFLSSNEDFVQMFITEARLASRLDHANVVQIFGFDKHEDSYYLIMEYVRGCSLWDLRKRCREKGISIPPVLVAHIGAQVAAGLHHAHRLKSADGEPLHLVHRDVTPHNVLLSFDGAVKLTDFGIAKASNKLTQPGVLKGKFAYMSPEQSRGEAVDARTDVFALGVVLWEMLTGGRLFDGDSELAVLRAVRESVITPPARLNPDVPEELDEVVSIALERDPEARYQSAGELERALAECVLHRATSVDDTDVGTFVRRLFDVPLTQFIPVPSALMERSSRSRSGGVSAAGTSSGARALSRTGESPLEESLVSASTHVLSREPLPPRSTLPLPSAQGSRNSRPTSVVGPAEQGSAPEPAASTQVMPTGASGQAPTGPKRGGKGLWVGVGAVALTLIGGAAALVLPSKQPAPEASSAGKAEVPAPPAAGPAATEAPDAGAVAAVTPSSEPPPAQTGAAGQTPMGQGPTTVSTAPQAEPAEEAKGTLTVKAVPYADVYLDGKLVKAELQRPMSIPLAPGTYRLTFKHPSRTDSSEVTITPNARVTKTFAVPRK
ncbi:serine/threonine protein kinase [Archangium sp.]|uniref:serine/threonine protein kinase n=1 Tax=Archangium sp. TaxID=1872627 RepID=UPI002D535AD1|nr:protein kinase [Archangium sp.]HYO59424.1 protein kinase [Archangium sp.]